MDPAPLEDTGCDTLTAWYADVDEDGLGDPTTEVLRCERPDGARLEAGDCDDADARIYPGAAETCDGVDQDCDGAIDEDLPITDWYADVDLDGYGDPASASVTDCVAPTGRVADATDCDDENAAIHPSTAELCENGLDDDCDGVAPACGIVGPQSLEAADAGRRGVMARDLAGWSVAGAEDVDGDGLDDVLVGAPQAGTNFTGAAYLLLGSLEGESRLSIADATFVGDEEGRYAGRSVAGAGDTDGDGYADVLVGGGASPAGHAWLVRGPVSSLLNLGSADVEVVGEDHDRLGYALAGAGDVDGDGYSDALIGAYAADDAAGAALLLRGPELGTAARLAGENAGDVAGMSVASAGDVDGDGLGDLLVGAPWALEGAGAVYLVRSPVDEASTLADADARLEGENPLDYAGICVSGAGDVDGDGKPDLLVGAWGSDEAGNMAGVVYVVSGTVRGSLGLAGADGKLVGENAEGRAGYAVSRAGDVDRDGHDDVLVGAYGDDGAGQFAGAGYLVRGPLAGTLDLADADAKLLGAGAEERAALAVAGAGDVNGDGWADILIGSPYSGPEDEGAAHLWYGGGF